MNVPGVDRILTAIFSGVRRNCIGSVLWQVVYTNNALLHRHAVQTKRGLCLDQYIEARWVAGAGAELLTIPCIKDSNRC